MEGKNRFSIKVLDIGKLFSQIKQPTLRLGENGACTFFQFVMGSLPLQDPLTAVEIKWSSNGSEYNMNATFTINVERHDVFLALLDEKEYEKFFIGYKTKQYLEYVYVFDLLGNEEFIISPELGDNEMEISISIGDIHHASGFGTSSKLITNESAFASDLYRFLGLVETFVNCVYDYYGIIVHKDATLLVKPNFCQSILLAQNNSLSNQDTHDPDDVIRRKIVCEKPKVTFGMIGGQKEAVKEAMFFCHTFTRTDIRKKWAAKPPKGILLCGPPGVGKTMLAQAIANHCSATFLNVKLADIASPYIWQTSRLMHAVFDYARKNSPAIIFIDEIDVFSTSRNSSDESTQQVATVIQTNMNGFQADENITLIAATNRIEVMDSAILRAGRFDLKILMQMPDEKGRNEILGIHLRKANLEVGRKLFCYDTRWAEFGKMTEGFSCAEIAELVRRVLNSKLRSEIEGKKIYPLVTFSDMEEEIKKYEHNQILGKARRVIKGFEKTV